MWHFQGGQTNSDPSYIFSGVRTPNPQDLRPCSEVIMSKCSSLNVMKVAVIQQQFWMKECDIFSGGQNIFWPLLHIFMGSWPQPPGSTSLAHTHRMREKQLSVVFEVQEPNFLSLCPFACNTYVVTWKVLKGCKWITALASLHSMRLKKINMLILINVTANS